jgi:hypothetical protein
VVAFCFVCFIALSEQRKGDQEGNTSQLLHAHGMHDKEAERSGNKLTRMATNYRLLRCWLYPAEAGAGIDFHDLAAVGQIT